MQRSKLFLFLVFSGILLSLVFIDHVRAIESVDTELVEGRRTSQKNGADIQGKPNSVVENEVPVMELVFCLDATGSMSGLIATAKEKIWDIVTVVSQSSPTPEIRLGMVFYRDLGDNFVTKTYPLTSNIDSIYSELLTIQAEGGGDTPESVNQALHEAVTQMGWGVGQNVYRTIFLVGDCAPHMDYSQDVKYPASCKLSTEKGIYINTIKLGLQCADAIPHFKAIAKCANGEYKQLGQNADDVIVETPYDDSISTYSSKIDFSKLYYGSNLERDAMKEKKRKAIGLYGNASLNAVASRATFNTSIAGKANFYGNKELIEDLMSGKVKLSDLSEEELPEQVREVIKNKRNEYLEQLQKERTYNVARLIELTKKREEFISLERKNNTERSSFSEEIYEIVIRQAARKNFLRPGLGLLNSSDPATGMIIPESKATAYPSAKVSLTDFAVLIAEVAKDRDNRLLSLDDFLVEAQKPKTVVLDARSREMYMNRHLGGAINLPYTEFTSESLARLIPDPNTRILIYCNNNFDGDPDYFMGKGLEPVLAQLRGVEPRLLALNIPTHVTLRGYGYQNVYELDEMVVISDLRLQGMWEGISTEAFRSTQVRALSGR